MIANDPIARDVKLLSYTVASADMKYIEVNEREIYLRFDPATGYIVRGEMPECGTSCHANLAQILLEYAMTCENCKNPTQSQKSVGQFGERLGQSLAKQVYMTADPVSAAFDCILNSLEVPFSMALSAQKRMYKLGNCPINELAEHTGLVRARSMAHLAFAVLCQAVMGALAPDWELVKPTRIATEEPLVEIVVAKKTL